MEQLEASLHRCGKRSRGAPCAKWAGDPAPPAPTSAAGGRRGLRGASAARRGRGCRIAHHLLPGGPRGREACRRRCASSCAPRPAARRSCSPRRVAALVWVNVDSSSYDALWTTTLSIDVGGRGRRARPARVGQQRADGVLLLRRRARGAARVRPRRAARAAAVRAAAARRDRRDGGRGRDLPRLQRRPARRRTAGEIAMSTDTAFALGLLALVGPRFPDRLRAFMLTVVVVDDILALVVIATRLHGGDRRCPRCSSRSRCSASCSSCAALARAASGSSTSCSASAIWVGAARVGRRAGRRRARDGPARLRLPGGAVGPRARDRAVPRVPRAADRRSSLARRATGSAPRSRRTSGCSSSSTRGRAT